MDESGKLNPEKRYELLNGEVYSIQTVTMVSGIQILKTLYLAAEVSDTTLAYDRGKKLKRYAEADLQEVWIVNLKDRHTEVYLDPMGEEYLTRFVVKPG